MLLLFFLFLFFFVFSGEATGPALPGPLEEDISTVSAATVPQGQPDDLPCERAVEERPSSRAPVRRGKMSFTLLASHHLFFTCLGLTLCFVEYRSYYSEEGGSSRETEGFSCRQPHSR